MVLAIRMGIYLDDVDFSQTVPLFFGLWFTSEIGFISMDG